MSADTTTANGESKAKRVYRRRPFGLRARVITFFALGALLLSMILSIAAFFVVRHTLIDQRETLAERQTYVNARLVHSGLNNLNKNHPNVPVLLSSLGNPTGSETLLYSKNEWYSSDLHVQADTMPSSFRNLVLRGTPARMVYKSGGTPELAVGVPIPSVSASYFEVSSLNDIERTLTNLSYTLIVVSIVTTVGGALLGSWSTRLVLRPVTKAAQAAGAIAGGDMTTRLNKEGDSDLDRLASSFNSMVDALQTRIERDARFASDVSHELRSPLMTLMSGVSVLQGRRDELPPRSQTALDLLADEIQRFQRMVQDLLEISRTDAGHIDIAFEEVFVGEFVVRVAERYERDIPIEMDRGLDEATMEVDKRRMERVIGNLIENADRYAGGVILITIKSAGRNVRILVDDAGPGVPPEERERVFERFARGATARARASGEGTGLGLSLVDEHVRLHKGRVWVEDRPGGGARFVVELPRADA
jgi:two-component system, OmpR family, sensor histidine kinase MtrB